MKTKNIIRNQKGMVPVWELLLLVALVAVIGFVGYRAYQAKQSKPTTTTSQNQTTVDPYAGWKTYTSRFEGVSFKYPTEWTFKEEANENGNGDPAVTGSKKVTLTSPNGFKLQFLDDIGGIGGACPDDRSKVTLTEAEKLVNANGRLDIYFVSSANEMGITDTYAGTPAVGLTDDCVVFNVLRSKTHQPDGQWAFGEGISISEPSTARPQAHSADLTTAELILRSTAYR